MRLLYCTLGHGQPNFPGVIKVTGSSDAACREAVWKLTNGRFCNHHYDMEDVHHLDRRVVCTIEAIGESPRGSVLPKVVSTHEDVDVTIFEGYKYAI